MAPARQRVLFTDRAWPDADVEREVLAAVGAELIEATATDEATLRGLAADADAIMVNWAPVTASVIQGCPRCKIISRTGIGVDNIDVAMATSRQIPVTNVPDYCVEEVSDHTLALLLACARNVGFFHHRTKQGEYRLQAGPPMGRLRGKVLGLIGLGRIGQSVCRKAQGLGLEVVAVTPSGHHHGAGCSMVSLVELLESSDFVSLHAPLTTATRHLLCAKRLALMKHRAYVINTSRGGLIDHHALWQALQRDEIAGAALDVFDPEPPDLSHPLFQDERVILTPHAAFVSQESVADLRRRASEHVARALQGQRPPFVVNPQIFE